MHGGDEFGQIQVVGAPLALYAGRSDSRSDAAPIALSRRAGVFGNTPRTGEIEKWLTEFGLDIVTVERSGAVEFFEARLPVRKAD